MEEIPIVLIGHKDHGKSTLIGRLLLETKSIKESKLREIQEVDEALGRKFELAHLVDSFKEEREREMTIETTSSLLKGEKRNYQLIDVPGHRELISQMLTGTSKATAAILVVSIQEGIREQTIQHLEIAKLLGIERLGVVINKMDKVDYRKDIFEKLAEKLKKILKEIGYFPENIRFFPISALEGDNVITKSPKTLWFTGPTLMNFLENELKKSESFENLPLRFLVQDKYLQEDEILVGKVESGKLKIGQEVLLLPENKKNKIKLIKDAEGDLNNGSSGMNLGLILKNKSKTGRGTVISSPNSPPQVSNILSGEIFWIEKPRQRKLICECGTAQREAKLLEPKVVKAKEKTFYKVRLKRKIAFDSKSKTILGKIVLKEKGKIIGVGNIK
jgi:bifunctional enzyme CysN/CysC/sulfate adenylyltransferase subunit 1